MPEPLIKFDDLELDLASYQLRRNGSVLKLEKIPMELLILLVTRSGQLVRREEIVDKLWGKDVFLDSEQGVNTAIRKIRQVLDDDPDQPRFIETVVGKGYRFVARINTPVEPQIVSGISTPSRSQIGTRLALLILALTALSVGAYLSVRHFRSAITTRNDPIPSKAVERFPCPECSSLCQYTLLGEGGTQSASAVLG